MAEPTTRDRVWAAALRLGIESYASSYGAWYSVKDVMLEAGLQDSQRRTAKRTLDAMTELGWLAHEPGSSKYRAEHVGRLAGGHGTNHYWADDRRRQRQLAKMARDVGSVDEMFPLDWFIDAVEDKVKDEAVQRWREEAAEIEGEPTEA